jgi:lipopolysaccharide export system protein LptA
MLAAAAAAQPAAAPPAAATKGDAWLPREPGAGNVQVDVTGDKLTADENTGWMHAAGNVRIVYGDHELTADEVRVNTQTGEIVAGGHVVLTRRGQGSARYDRLSYNYKTGVGLTTAVDLRARDFRILAGESRRQADGTYLLRGATVTTCTNAPGDMHWHVTGRSLDYDPARVVTVHGAVPHFLGAPFAYLPWWRRDLANHYGLRVIPGYSSRWGGYLLSSYKVPVADYGGGERITTKTRLDLRSERGLGAGQDLDWEFGDDARGFLSVYFLDDRLPGTLAAAPEMEVENPRYRFAGRQAMQLAPADALLLQASYLSDADLLEDFFESEFRASRQPQNYATYQHAGKDWVAGVGASGRLNPFYDTVNRLPEAWGDLMRREIGESGVFYESSTRGGWLQRAFADYSNPSNPPAASYDTMRADTEHMIFLPRSLFGFLRVMPRAGGRVTAYGDTLQPEVSGAPGHTTTVTNEFGNAVTVYAPGTMATNWIAGGAGVRRSVELGIETSFKTFGLFGEGENRWRHVLEPYANYTFIPEPNLRPNELYRFDSVDTVDLTHQVRIGTRNQVQVKADKGVRTTADADLYAVYSFDRPDGAPTGLDGFGLDSKFRPASWLRFDLDGLYDAHASELHSADARARIWSDPLWEASGELLYRNRESTLLAGSLTYALTRAWTVSVFSRYEAENARLEEQGGYVQYQFDCLAFRFRLSYLPGYTRDDGTEDDSDFRVSFLAWLTAFPPERMDRP